MAESFEEDRKAALVARLKRSRQGISRNVDGLRHDLNVRTQLRSSVIRQKGYWLGGAAVAGWLLAGWPRRRKTLPAPSRKRKTSERKGGGFLLALFGFLGSIIRPAVTAFLTRKLKELAAGEDSRAHPRY